MLWCERALGVVGYGCVVNNIVVGVEGVARNIDVGVEGVNVLIKHLLDA